MEKATPEDLIAKAIQVDCPEPQAGKQLSVWIRPIEPGVIVAVLGGIPSLMAGEKNSGDTTAREFALMREVAARGIISPELTYGDEPDPTGDKPWWGMVRLANRAAIVNAIMAASGLTEPAGGGPLERFHLEPRSETGMPCASDAGAVAEKSERTPVAAD